MRGNRLLEPVLIICTFCGCCIVWVYLSFGGLKSYLTSKSMIHKNWDDYNRAKITVHDTRLVNTKNVISSNSRQHKFDVAEEKRILLKINDRKMDEMTRDNFDEHRVYNYRNKNSSSIPYLYNVENDSNKSKMMAYTRMRNMAQTRKKPYNKTVMKNITPNRNTKINKALRILNALKVDADDPRLIEIIRKYFIDPPSTLPYNLNFLGQEDKSMGQAPIVDSWLKNKKHGFFVESGAFDGETGSNTLFFEQARGWTGIIIEPNPLQYQKLTNKHRKSYSMNACLNTKRYPTEEVLYDDGQQSKIVSINKTSKLLSRNKEVFLIQCFPLYSILLALNQTYVDYLSLDVEGSEQGIIATIPWHKVDVQMMTIEYNQWPGGARRLCKDMRIYGYECLVSLSGTHVSDVVLKKKRRTRTQSRRNVNDNKPHSTQNL
ncbi:hypothetical protein ACF0H5_015076 [Mactra antiquata]